jgi:hypothetical protein
MVAARNRRANVEMSGGDGEHHCFGVVDGEDLVAADIAHGGCLHDRGGDLEQVLDGETRRSRGPGRGSGRAPAVGARPETWWAGWGVRGGR